MASDENKEELNIEAAEPEETGKAKETEVVNEPEEVKTSSFVPSQDDDEDPGISPEGLSSVHTNLPSERDTDKASVPETGEKEEERSGIAGIILRVLLVVLPLFVIAYVIHYYYYTRDITIPRQKYESAMALYNAGEYDKAASAFRSMGTYENSETMVLASLYAKGCDYLENAEYDYAIKYFEASESYSDADMKILECYYLQAEDLFNDEMYLAAADIYTLADGYKDSVYKINLCKLMRFDQIEVMDTIFFGRYNQQDKDEKEPIEWIVIHKTDDEVLLLSRYILDCVSFAEKGGDVTWEHSDLREWLNNDFLNEAFNETEKTHLVSEMHFTGINPEFRTQSGAPTTDAVCVMSIEDVQTYFYADEARIAEPTPYALSRGVFVNEVNSGLWWLRNRAENETTATVIHFLGFPYNRGMDNDSDIVGVRPMIRITTDFSNEK